MQDPSDTKTEAAYRLLRREILATRLRPGAPLKLSTLRGQYGMGWTPLREALSRLEAEHLVTAISNRGFAVAPVSPTELSDLERSRLLIEIPLMIESMTKGDREWEDMIAAAHYRLSRCKTAVEDPSDAAVNAWDETHEVFHAALVSASSSVWLLRFRETISEQLRRHHRFLSLAPALRASEAQKDGYEEAMIALGEAQSIESHTALMEAMLDRDEARVAQLMNNHGNFALPDYFQREHYPAQQHPMRPSRAASTSSG